MPNSEKAPTCQHCGDEMPPRIPGTPGRPAKYCSTNCQVSAWRKRKANERRAALRAELAKLDPNSPDFQKQVDEANERSQREIREIYATRAERALNSYRRPGRPPGSKDRKPRQRRKSE